MKNKIEILAPAGSIEAMKAAMEAGCDAVYIGGTSFGARAYADNLSEEMLLSAIDYAHLRGKSLYLTVNTLIKEREMEQRLYRYMERFYRQGLDAAIVQDPGVLRFLHRNFPELPLHASTQMTITSADALPELAGMGLTRIVTARELSLAELRKIREATDLEIESFVHGALCYCYSGQCLFSSLSGARSGNRGRCTQPCRLEYRTEGDFSYLLSPKDMCTLEMIPELVEAGIDSFKIEGRMKRPEYAAFTAHAYRKWTDRYLELGKEGYAEYVRKHSREMEEDIRSMADLYNRGGFSTGYYRQHNGRNMMSLKRPNHQGVEAVKVLSVKKNSMLMEALLDLNGQDVIDIRRNGNPEYEFTLKDPVKKGDTFMSRFLSGSRIKPGMTGYRTKNASLLSDISESFIKHTNKLPVTGVFTAEAGKPMTLTVSRRRPDGSLLTFQCEGVEAQRAEKQPVTEDRVRQALAKTGDSPYEWEKLTLELSGDLFLAMSAVNNLRREALDGITESWLAEFARELPEAETVESEAEGAESAEAANSATAGSVPADSAVAGSANSETAESETAGSALTDSETAESGAAETDAERDMAGVPVFSASVLQEEQLTAVLASELVSRVYLPLDVWMPKETGRLAESVTESGKSLFLRMPRIFRSGVRDIFDREWELWKPVFLQADGVLFHNLEELHWLKEKQKQEPELAGLDLLAGENIPVWNREAKEFLAERGVQDFTVSLELTEAELAELAQGIADGSGLTSEEIILYGRETLMVSAQCVRGHTSGCLRAQEAGNGGQRMTAVKDVSVKDVSVNGGAGSGGVRPLLMTDRRERSFPVFSFCRFCYNQICQSEPIDLSGSRSGIAGLGISRMRLDFTLESGAETERILRTIAAGGMLSGGTTGHFLRGVE